MNLLSVEDALRRVLSDVGPVGSERIPLAKARGRVLAEPATALRTQPPFDASAMDGYALRAADSIPGTVLTVTGEAAAGRAHAGVVGPGEAVRIFTGAPVPDGADAVLVQEQARREGNRVTAQDRVRPGQNIRRTGLDFRSGDAALAAPLLLSPRDLALAAAANHPSLVVRRRPVVAILATGDEIVMPGGAIGPNQIVASNNFALAAIVEAEGGRVVDLGIAGDSLAALEDAFGRARDAGADVLVTIGGASVGDHDLVQAALVRHGMTLDFWRIAMRPGKPMMHGHLGPMRILGMPGNPVSAIVCGILFLVPLIRTLLGRSDVVPLRRTAHFAVDWPANDFREDYLRAAARLDTDGERILVTPSMVQDSSMVSVLRAADCLVIRPPNAPEARIGESCRIIDLRAEGY